MRAFAVIRNLLHGREAAGREASATRDSLSEAFHVGSEVCHAHFGHGIIVKLYDDRQVASAEVLFDNGNVRSFAKRYLTKAPPWQPLAGRGAEHEAQAGSSSNPLNAAR